MLKRFLALAPFLILAAIALYNLFEFVFMDYVTGWRHRLAFGLLAVNACLYFYRFRPAIVATGIILLLATFNLLSFYTETTVSAITVGGISTPGVQLSMLFLLILYVVLEFDLLVNWYLDFKEGKES